MDPLPQFYLFFGVGIASGLAFGGIISVPSFWRSIVKPGDPVYLKAGEYGESEKVTVWSIFKEPLNAWTSLAYSVFGIVILLTGLTDYSTKNEMNTVSRDPAFSLLYGASMIYLGIASCLFHASHAEIWRKADAGMTSGVMAAPLVLGIWDRVRPNKAFDSLSMAVLALIFQFSLTHGYLPYGSSDILLPTLVGLCWILELFPRYGGVVDRELQYTMWLQCFFGAVGGMLLRLTDIKRKASFVAINIIRIYFLVLTFFAIFLGHGDYVVIVGLIFGFMVYLDPSRGHICWHIGSSYALFIWWYMLRVRPGDAPSHFHPDGDIISVIFYMVIKNAIRRLFMNVSFLPGDLHKRAPYLTEHVFFVIWGGFIFVTPAAGSWMWSTVLCWSPPVYPSEIFRIYYQAKIASHSEDLVYMAVDFYNNSNFRFVWLPQLARRAAVDSGRTSRDLKMDLHHCVTAALCIASYFSNYAKIGSLVMFLHDISDLPLDFLRLFSSLGWKYSQMASYGLTLVGWLYWRLWFFPVSVLYSIAVESKSVSVASPCEPGSCTLDDVPERIPFLVLLGTLYVLHWVWGYELAKKGYMQLCQKPKMDREYSELPQEGSSEHA